MGEAKRRRELNLPPRALAPVAPASPYLIRVRPCLMTFAQRCAVSFRVVPDQPAVFMCQAHWKHVPEDLRETLRLAAADDKNKEAWKWAAKTAVLCVLQALVAIDGGSIPEKAAPVSPAEPV